MAEHRLQIVSQASRECPRSATKEDSGPLRTPTYRVSADPLNTASRSPFPGERLVYDRRR